MQALREQLSLAMNKFESLFQKTENDLQVFKIYAMDIIGVLKGRIQTQEATIVEQKKSIEDLCRQLIDFQDCHFTKDQVRNIENSIAVKIDAATASHLASFQDFQRHLKACLSSCSDDLMKFSSDIDIRFAELQKKTESDLEISRLDKEGIERELIRYKKDVFYIEKKIENIYTLIDRINKRGGSCRKPE